MLLVGILLVILRWNAIREVLQETFRAYFP